IGEGESAIGTPWQTGQRIEDPISSAASAGGSYVDTKATRAIAMATMLNTAHGTALIPAGSRSTIVPSGNPGLHRRSLAAGAPGLHRPEAAAGGDEAPHPQHPDQWRGVGLQADSRGVHREQHQVEVPAGPGHDGGRGDAGGIVPEVVGARTQLRDETTVPRHFDRGSHDLAARLSGLEGRAVSELVAT